MTFDKAMKAYPEAQPLFHSDRGFQYTNRTFHYKQASASMIQISNSPKGAAANVSIYNLLETCKANKAEPYKYFEYILKRLLNDPSPKTSEDFERYMPWNPEIQVDCKL